jgi:hypothetical protein
MLDWNCNVLSFVFELLSLVIKKLDLNSTVSWSVLGWSVAPFCCPLLSYFEYCLRLLRSEKHAPSWVANFVIVFAGALSLLQRKR